MISIELCQEQKMNNIDLFNDKMSEKLFYKSGFDVINEISDITKIRNKIDNRLTFYNMNLGDEFIPVRKKYDFVYTSNISDYICHSIKGFTVYRDNLEQLINDDGAILSVNLRKLGFEEKFKYHNMPKVYKYSIFSLEVPGYYYVKEG